MPTHLTYPKRLTDPEWKKTEKVVKVSATGIGETLRKAEKSVTALAAQLKLNKDHAKVVALANTAIADCRASASLINTMMAKHSAKKPAFDAMGDYKHRLGRLASELEALTKLKAGDDIADKADRVADRVKTIVGG